MPSEDQLLEVAVDAARAAAAELMDRYGREAVGLRSKSSPTDPVSAADVAAERAIRAVLATRRPGDAILGEEGGLTPAAGGREVADGALRWIVDPLDGTVNYLYGVPQFAVSVACEDREGAVVGAVLDPVRGECFTAVRGGGARVDGRSLEPDWPSSLSRSLVATGFGYDPDVRAKQGEVLTGVLSRTRDIRRAGAAALDLCWCACGRYDAYYERGVKAWDIAAGGLICSEVGLTVRRLAAVDGMPDGLLVAPPALVDELAALVDRPA